MFLQTSPFLFILMNFKGKMNFLNNIKFTKSQKVGMIVLLGFIILLQIIILHFDTFFPPADTPPYKIPLALQQQYDSLKKRAQEKKKQIIYPFNPNYISENKAYFLGIDLKSLKRIENFRKKGKYFQSKEEFRKVSGISDSVFQLLAPYISIPVFKKYTSNTSLLKDISNKDINKATDKDLQVISGIGPVLSKRIVKYRTSIGGFKNKNQLNNVYGLTPEVVKNLWKVFYLQKTDKKPLVKKGINSANMEDLKKVNGIGDKLAQRIISFRNKIGGFAIKEELNTIYGLKPEVRERLWENFIILQPKNIKEKISLNNSNIKELATHPYISYPLAKRIVSYRTIHGGFKSIDELMEVPDFPKNRMKIIRLYLVLE